MCKPNPPMLVTPSVAPHPDSLPSVLILKSICGIFMLFIALRIACNHHFNYFIAKVHMHTFASQFCFLFSKYQ